MIKLPIDSKKTILLVDKHEFVRDFLLGMIEDWGYNVKTSESPEKALEILEESLTGSSDETIDGVITGFYFGKSVAEWSARTPVLDSMGGLQFIEQVQKLRSDLPVLISTGSCLSESEVAFIKSLKRSDILKKPYDPNDLNKKMALFSSRN